MQTEIWVWIWMEKMSEDIGFLTTFLAILAVHTGVLLLYMELHTRFP